MAIVGSGCCFNYSVATHLGEIMASKLSCKRKASDLDSESYADVQIAWSIIVVKTSVLFGFFGILQCILVLALIVIISYYFITKWPLEYFSKKPAVPPCHFSCWFTEAEWQQHISRSQQPAQVNHKTNLALRPGWSSCPCFLNLASTIKIN